MLVVVVVVVVVVLVGEEEEAEAEEDGVVAEEGGAGLVGCCWDGAAIVIEVGACVCVLEADVAEGGGGGGTLSVSVEVKQPEASNSFILASSSPHASWKPGRSFFFLRGGLLDGLVEGPIACGMILLSSVCV